MQPDTNGFGTKASKIAKATLMFTHGIRDRFRVSKSMIGLFSVAKSVVSLKILFNQAIYDSRGKGAASD